MQKEENLESPSQNKAEEVKRQGTSKARKAQCGARLPNRRGGVWLRNPLYAPLSGRVARPIHSTLPHLPVQPFCPWTFPLKALKMASDAASQVTVGALGYVFVLLTEIDGQTRPER